MNELTRRTWLIGASAGFATALTRPAAAQVYPQRPVKIIVPYAPGGGTDIFSRLLAAQVEREFGQPLVIDNRGGGASIVGTQAVATAQPDGYTIGMVDSAFVTNPGLYKEKLPYDTRRDFVPVSLLSRTQLVLIVHPSSPYKTAQDLIAHAKANPGKLTFGSAGIGTGIHYAGEQFRQIAGIEIVVVPYRGGAPMVADFVSGKLDFTFGAVPTIKQHIYDGRARALGTTRGRSPQLPDVPSLEEIGLGSVEFHQRDGHHRAGCDAGADRAEAQSDCSQRSPDRAVQVAPQRSRLLPARDDDRRMARPYRCRDRKVDQDHRGGQRQAGVRSNMTASRASGRYPGSDLASASGHQAIFGAH